MADLNGSSDGEPKATEKEQTVTGRGSGHAVRHPMDALLTAQEVAAVLQVSVDSVYSYARTGRLPRVRLDRAVRFRPADVRAFIDRAAQPARLTQGGK